VATERFKPQQELITTHRLKGHDYTHVHELNTRTTAKSSVTDTQSPTSTEDQFTEICNICVGVVIISSSFYCFWQGDRRYSHHHWQFML